MIDMPTPVLDSLSGLAFGDAFGDRWFAVLRRQGPAGLEARTLPPEPLWRWSDDTAQAIVLVRELAEGGGTVDQDRLAVGFAAAYAEDTHRGYGASMHALLHAAGRENAEAECAQAAELGLLATEPEGPAVRFAHPLISAALY
ncbi:ADP-ribosylglycohydrolase family protein, partial [Streptomyces sp. NPDC048279]|uniref:ADP-ribosylglycohydrolase family protein n=1 Tax=Streptomyces sp. NPDC048279 TaxID=3154714 RepID=UPI00342B950F